MLVEHAAQWIWKAMGGTRIEALYTLLVFLGVLLIVRCIQWLRYIRTLPPGPWGVPVFGYLPFLKGDVHLQYGELAKKYGSMFSARLGTQLVVVLSDYRVIRDTFRREEFSGRPHTEFINILGGYGVINTEGAMWKDQRRFLHEKLRSFGMTYMGAGKKIMESRIMREVDTFIQGLLSRQGAPTDVSPSLGMSISNVICSIIMGVRFHHGDSRFKRFMDLIEEGFKLFGSIAAVNFIPIMRYLPCLQKVQNKISQNRAEMADFFQETVDQHRVTFDENNIRDLVDAYLLEIQKAKAEGREALLFQGKNHDRQMQQILGDLFSAGMETVKTTLEWAVILMLHHPEAAKAVQEELDQVVGRSRMPALEDLPFLPVTEATILEVLRRSSIVPLGTTHATTRDVTLNGYTIPAGSQVVPLLHAVHMDPELWNEPEEFRPTRFLSAEGKVCKPEYFMPFGVGRRMCLGDVLARMELFLFFSSLLHTFDLRLPEGASLPSLRGNAGVTVTPDPFKVCLFRKNLDLLECDPNEPSSGPLRNVGSL
ncbi:cytochrome P450 18a1-like [Vespa mandarinia]|uniref:cytochrome P450 18a1-like n=1 Tax=Vespa mandarinia TaxID=7446 RepID=UPI0016214D47|nr:cytochrome P450 18a1-like [Vespa mandarinia]XP_046837199.1 cytochrome P450 18a1 [Vespa crabro]XP_047368456.1 cytochrome P450 18a1 [Vespa velutina]